MKTAKILLVDDVKVFIEFERPFFERAGCVILTAASGPDALRIVRDELPHIVLLDYEMPGMNGDEVCHRIKQDPATSHIPVLIVTSHHQPDVTARCMRAGCTDVITKPVAGRELLSRVVKLLEIPYRVHMRTRVSMEVSLGLGADTVAVLGYSENVSEGGMLVETIEPPDTGSKVRLSFAIPHTKARIATTAEVIRSTHSRASGMFTIALRFEPGDTVFSEAVRSFVEQEVGR